MSYENFLGKHATRVGTENANDPAADQDLPEDLGAFGWLRGIRERAVSLELRKRDGNILAVGYGWLERVEFDPSLGITLTVSGRKIRITGRNLNAEVRPMVRLFEGIVRHRVPWLCEAGERDGHQAPDSGTVIETIEW